MKSIFKSNFFSLGVFFGLSILLIIITNHYILTVNFFNNSGEILSGIPNKESEVFEALQKYIYLSTLFYTTLKLFFIALILYTALFLADQQVKFSRALNIVILSEYIFLLPALIKIIWFKVEYPAGTLSNWHKVFVFSALSLFDNVSADWYYPLQTLNLFEIGYWFLLAYGIYKSTTLTYDQSLKIVVFSYVPGLFIWVVSIAFCTVMIFPDNA